MDQPGPSQRVVRFGVFEVDLQAGELRRQGLRLKLQEKPFQVLALLLERPGEVVTREELQQRLWPDVNVDFEHSLSTAIKKLRDALGDSADNPVFIETRPGRGYRFLYPVDGTPTPSPVAPATGKAGSPRREPRGSAVWILQRVGIATVAVGVVVGLLVVLNVSGLRERLLGPPPPQIDSLAVLPLKNLMGDPEQDYFVQGMHEALITELSKISALKVISRSSAMHYKDSHKRLPQIARELGVNGLIEGSVLREGDQVRITVQLLHAPSDRHLWAESFDRDLRGILALHSDVARAIAREIRIALTPADETRLAGHRRLSPDSYVAYLKGYHHMQQFSPASFQSALEYFEDAIRKDPNNALGFAGLALVYGGMTPTREPNARRRAAAEKALALDESLGEAYAALAGLKFMELDYAGADKDFRRAIELNPSYGEAHHRYSHLLAALGRFDDSLRASQRFVEIDPLSPVAYVHLGWHYHVTRQYDRAIEQYRKALEMDPNFVDAHYRLGEAYLQRGRYAEGIAALQKAAVLGREPTTTLAELVYAYAVSGRRKEAESAMRELLAQAQRGSVAYSLLARAYEGLGQKELALQSLEKAFEEPVGYELVEFHLAPEFDSLRPHPRFQALLRRMNFPEN